MQSRLEAGYWPFYPPPGYTYAKVPGHGKLLVRKEPEAGIIQEALEGFASGRFPCQVHVQGFLPSIRGGSEPFRVQVPSEPMMKSAFSL